jgi:Trypsin-like peptidase domain
VKLLWKFLLVGLLLGIDGLHPLSAAVFNRKGQKLSETGLDPTQVDWQLLEARQNSSYSGIGLIKIRNFSNCTGFFVQSSNTAPAYVVTNAHCIDLISKLLGPNEIVVNRNLRTSGRSAPVLTYTPNYFARPDSHSERLRQRPRRTYRVQKVLYATMKNSDIAILELPITQGELMRTGIVPLQIARQLPSPGQRIEVVGVPGEVLPENRQFLHRSTCLLGATVQVREGVYQWTHALRNRCSVVGGMSGSPMISNGQAVGIINTGGGYDRVNNLCALNNPCEVGANGRPVATINENYGQQIDRLPGCFTNQGLFSLNQPGCRLDKPRGT